MFHAHRGSTWHGKKEIDAREFISLESHHVEQFIGLQVTAGGEYAQSATALIPYDSIDRLTAAIDRLGGINPSSTKNKQIEVVFSLAPDFKLIVFTDTKGKLMFSVSAQAATAYFGDLLKMSDLKSYLQKAKRTIDENRPRQADQNLPSVI